jgi:hypothetical protein
MSGSFEDSLDDLLSLFAIPQHQIAAASFPTSPLAALAAIPPRKEPTLDQLVNEQLSKRTSAGPPPSA